MRNTRMKNQGKQVHVHVLRNTSTEEHNKDPKYWGMQVMMNTSIEEKQCRSQVLKDSSNEEHN